jgi:hypothetical protein
VVTSICYSGLGIVSLIEHRPDFLSRCHLVKFVYEKHKYLNDEISLLSYHFEGCRRSKWGMIKCKTMSMSISHACKPTLNLLDSIGCSEESRSKYNSYKTTKVYHLFVITMPHLHMPISEEVRFPQTNRNGVEYYIHYN